MDERPQAPSAGFLGRAPDPEALANCIAMLLSGATIDDLHALIIASDEYQNRTNPGRTNELSDAHPLAHLNGIYTLNNVSYFTHRGKYRPLGLGIETINICNNDCIICPYSKQTRQRQTMSMELFAKILHAYSEIGGGPVMLTPMVGEVFLDKLLLERLKLLRSNPSVTQISAISNATMVQRYSDEELRYILSFFDRMTISVYGLDAQEYAAMTQKDEYEKQIAGITRVLAIMGPDKVSLGGRHLVRRTDAEIQAWLSALSDRAGITGVARFSGTLTYANWGVLDTSRPLPFDATWSPVTTNTAQCALPLISLQILSDGKVSFCGCADYDGNPELGLGTVQEQSLAELLGSDRVRRLWKWESEGMPNFCKSCSFHMPIENLAGLPSAFADPFGTFGG